MLFTKYYGKITDKKDLVTKEYSDKNILLSNASAINNITVTTDATKGVSPYNASYGYTNIEVDTTKVAMTEAELTNGTIIGIQLSAAVSSSYRNVRIRFGSAGRWIPLFGTTDILGGSSFLTASAYRQFIYSTGVYASGAFHMAHDSNSTYTPPALGIGYGTCSTAAATAAKVVTLSSYSLVTGGIVAVKFTYAVPASATMNINSKGAKAIFYNGAAITAGVIKAGDIATFIFDGTQYRLLAVNTDITGKQDKLSSGTNIKTINGTSVLGSGNIDTQEVFWATYGTTTHADIKAAYDANKVVKCKAEEFVYSLFDASSSDALFILPIDENVFHLSVTSENVWSNSVKFLIKSPSSASLGQVITYNGANWVAGDAPVTKVNNKTGDVSLTYSDVGADQSGAASSAVSTHNSNSSAHSSLFGNCLKNNENGTLTGNSSDTPLYLKSQSASTFLGFKNSSGTTLGYFGVDSSNKPVYYVSSNKQIALVEDVNTMLNRTTAVNVADTNYTSYMARGEALNSSDTTPTANGAISWTYE